MRATKVLLVSAITVFAVFFLGAFADLDERSDFAGHVALGAFQFCGAAVSLYLLSSREDPGNASLFDWLGCAAAILIACIGFAGWSITLFAFYLFIRDRQDLNTRAAGTIAAAVAIQSVWAPLVFSKLSFLLLQIDADVVGWLVGQFVPGAFWSGTVVYTPSGHNVEITAPCASFHNLSLAALCWITLTMLHRPYWVKGDLFVGLVAALIQFGFNVWRLVFVCLSPAMYEFWHEGFGKHIFSGVATASAIIFVQISLVRRDQQDSKRVAAIS
jgi:exosortase/archaeosortase family protein